MARLETTVKNVLMAESDMTAIVGARGFDRDYRTDGWHNAPIAVFDSNGVFLPTLIVTREEGVHPLGSPINARRQFIIVWGIASNSDDGYDDVQSILDVSWNVLTSSPDLEPILGYDIHWSGELGPYRFDDGCVGRFEYSFSGIPGAGG